MISEKQIGDLFTSIYMGGGTPSILDSSLIDKLLRSISEKLRVSEDVEFTVEANPATLSKEKLSVMRRGGVNRISLGCQSIHENELKRIARIHSFDDFCESFELVRSEGFDNVSVDLIYGLPEQTLSSLLESVEKISDLSPDHISLYGLRVEPDTPLGRDRHLVLPDEDVQCEMYSRACDLLRKKGYLRYEISNFAKDGKFSRHNMRYWECKEYIGLGAAAHSYLNGIRYAYERDAVKYIESLEKGSLPLPCESIEIKENDMLEEFIILSMRLERGLDLFALEEAFGSDAKAELLKRVRPYVPKFIIERDGHLSFTTDGFLVSSAILSDLI
jgi:oxygen-independent coproporphyrinogen-3 oxidase